MLLSLVPEEDVLSNPLAIAIGQSPKYVQSLYMGKQRITRIGNFARFVNLNVLYLNDNRLSVIDGLESCVRLKELFLQNNRITSIAGKSIASLRYMTKLNLSRNRLKNLSETLPFLRHMKQLEELDLFGNPLSEEQHYRLLVIHALKSVTVLDRIPVTKPEIEKADRLHVELVRSGHCISDSHHPAARPNLAFGKRWNLKPEAPQQYGPISMLSAKVIAKAKKVERQLARRHRDNLLALYGDCGERHYPENFSFPVPHHLRTSGKSHQFWSRFELHEILEKKFNDRSGSVLTPSLVKDVISNLDIGQLPSTESLNQMISTWPQQKAGSATEQCIALPALLEQLCDLKWGAVGPEQLISLRDQLYAKAKVAVTNGKDSDGLVKSTEALAVERFLQERELQ
uniref:U2A'/phosphoprotein 32 family A C-terminal domain-containing protein n=1 Tax=Spongospora subterranea TaxID=70186 RepID=A0A0H5R983_9EUKA|eukprot:CRZ10267.1 hypothetical protein [Spongospora subterranea]